MTGVQTCALPIYEKQNVAVIGRMVQRDLIKNGDPVGKELEINGSVFKVIGVFLMMVVTGMNV